MEELKPGQLVRSLAGRDKGEHYLVLKVVDERYLLLVNGQNRPLSRPKKKNKAHLQCYRRRAGIEECAGAQSLTDSRIIKYLKELVPQADVEQEV